MSRVVSLVFGVGALVFALAVMLDFAASEAHAQGAQRVVVDSFGGPRGANTRTALVRDLEANGVEVVSSDEVDAARRELGIGRRMSSDDYVALGRALNVSAFIDGRVRRQRRRWSVTVTVRNAADGERVGSKSWGGRTAASLRGIGRNGHARLEEHLADTGAPVQTQVAATVPAGETPWYSGDGEDAETPWEADTETPTDSASPSASQRYDAIEVALTGGTLYRWMDTPVQVYASQRGAVPAGMMPSSAFIEETRSYRGPGIGHFELGGRLAFYPGAFGDQPFPYLGAIVSFSHSIASPAVGPHRDDGSPVAIPTNQLDFFVGARGRYRFGDDRREPEIHLDVGWGTFSFDLGTDALKELDPRYVIPPMEHGYVQLGAGISYGIVPTYLTASVDFAYRIGTNIGVGTRNVWGIETAPSNGMLVGLELKSEIPEIVQGAFIALRVEYFQFTTAFRGQVGCAAAGGCASTPPWEDQQLWEVWPVTPPPPGQPGDYNIDSVVGGPTGDVNDNYVRMQLSVGYAFR